MGVSLRQDIGTRPKQMTYMSRLTVRGIATQTLVLLAIVLLIPDPIRAEAAVPSHSVVFACDASQFPLVGLPAQPVCGDDDDEDGEDYEGSGRPDID